MSGYKYPSPILSLTVTATSSGEDRNVCVGMQSGTLAIRTKLSPTQKAVKRAREKEIEALMEGNIEEHDQKVKKAEKRKLIARGEGWQARIRGKDFVGEPGDIIVAPNIGRLKNRSRKTKASNIWDQPLRAARYPEALDNALATHDRAVVLTVLTALIHRSALRAALQGRTAKTLLPIISWLQRHISDPTCVDLAAEVSNVILDEYADNVPESQEVEEALEKLQEGVRRGLECVQMCLSTVGMLELLRGGEHPGRLA
jgi:U3 small nucleolar RNA-associated protein 15